jgi:tetratricopeptide (TPR) repeat protein
VSKTPSFYERGLAAYRLQRWELARSQFVSELGQNPGNALALGMIAACCLNMGEIAAAIENAREAIKTDPKLAYGYYIVCLAYLKQKDVLEAEMAIEEAISLEPRNPEYLSTCASIFFRRKKWSDGLSFVDRALEINPQHLPSLHLKHYALKQTKRKEAAAEVRRQIFALNPEDATMHADKGWDMLDENAVEALSFFEEAVRINPQESAYIDGLYEAKYYERSSLARVLKWFSVTRLVQAEAISLACLMIYMLFCHLSKADMSVPVVLCLIGAPLIVFLLATFAGAVNRGVYFVSMLLDKSERARLSSHVEGSLRSKIIGVSAGILVVGVALVLKVDKILLVTPHWLYSDWLPIFGERYAPLAPILFLIAVIAFPWTAFVWVLHHIRMKPLNTRYFVTAYSCIVCGIILAGFAVVGILRPGEWFLAVILVVELVLFLIPASEKVRSWAKKKIKNDQQRLPLDR